MSFIKIDNNNFDTVTLNLKPSTHFLSSSVGLGVTGSNFVSPFRSKCIKDPGIPAQNSMADGELAKFVYDESGISALARLQTINSEKDVLINYDLNRNMNTYLDTVSSSSQVAKNTKSIDIFRFDQPVNFNKNRNIKNVLRKNLMPFHKISYDNCHFSYCNYHTLNFFHSTTIPTGSALMYPNINGAYNLTDDFSLNFWINPRYAAAGDYKAGTILHLSSSFCVSLVSGSTKNEFNEADTFKIMLQLSQSADKLPSSVNLTTPASEYPNDLIFTSSATLSRNHWHHVCIQWSNKVNNGVGAIFVDDNRTLFTVNSSSLAAQSHLTPPALVVGNYLNATYGNQTLFLNSGSAALEGFTPNVAGAVSDPTITETMLNHPLQAEIHEIKMFNKVLETTTSLFDDEREIARNEGPASYDNLVFYIPPFFYPETPTREVLVTPFQKITSTTDDPFNVSFSFGVNGKLINLENFTREFVVGQNPRLVGLIPQTINRTVQNITADQYVYNSGSIKKRNMTIMPNDNGLFKPNYFVLSNATIFNNAKWFSNPEQINGKSPDYSIISLENLVPSSSLFPGLTTTSGEIFEKIAGSSPENPGVSPGAVLTIAQRTRDLSSNEVTILDISNLYYGNRIHPTSFKLVEKDLTGSDGKVKITLRDNGRGSLYRADAKTTNAEWNNVGNLLYDEGLAIIKSPHLFFIGKDLLDVSFKGEQNLHTMMIDIPVYTEMFNSSSNPTFVGVTPSTGANDVNLNTLYLTTVNIHDDNFNIIMKANFAQPIFKTEEDEFIIRLKEDF